MHYVQVLIAATWLGPCPNGMEVNHKNGNKTDCRSRNLEYLTRSQNVEHAYQVLRSRQCISWQQRKVMLRRHLSGETYASISTSFGVSPAGARWNIHKEIKRGKLETDPKSR